jgi:hypothetical protein
LGYVAQALLPVLKRTTSECVPYKDSKRGERADVGSRMLAPTKSKRLELEAQGDLHNAGTTTA